MQTILLFGVFVVLIAVGVPIGTALGVAGCLALFAFDLGADMIGVNVVADIAKFPLLAIPFFVLAGVIMERAGIAARISRCFEVLVGRMTGGLALVAVLTCIFWGAVSGSGPATTAAVGLILMGPMFKQGYDKCFSAATIADASSLSIIIPPSIAFIVYGNITGKSVSELFLAGVFPGLFMGGGVLLVAWAVSWHKGFRGSEVRGTGLNLARNLYEALWALLAPVIILGGIYLGVFTPTEAAVVGVFYSLFISLCVYKSMGWKDMPAVFIEATVTSAVILFIVVFAGVFSVAVSTLGLSDKVTRLILDLSPNPLAFVFLVNVLILILGMFLDAISICYLVLPILLPVLSKFQIDLIWYGVVFIVALAIGQVTPPVAVNIFTAANLSNSTVDAVSRKILPYVAINVMALIVITLFPELSTWLPRMVLTGR